MCSWNGQKLKTVNKKNFNSVLETNGFVIIVLMYFSFFLWCNEKSNFKQKISIFKRRSKFHQKNVLHKGALNFDQWKIILENDKPIRV